MTMIAAAGPHTRVALTPQPEKRIWTYDPAAPLPVHQLPDAVADDGSAAVLQYIRRRPGYRHPLEVHVSQRRIVIDADHGLGDGRFFLDLLSALLAVSGGRASQWVINDDTRLALPRALVATFGIHPARADGVEVRCRFAFHPRRSSKRRRRRGIGRVVTVVRGVGRARECRCRIRG